MNKGRREELTKLKYLEGAKKWDSTLKKVIPLMLKVSLVVVLSVAVIST